MKDEERRKKEGRGRKRKEEEGRGSGSGKGKREDGRDLGDVGVMRRTCGVRGITT